MNKRIPAGRILWYEGIGFLLIIASFWLCQIASLPARRADALITSEIWRTGSLVTIMVCIFAIPVMIFTHRLLSRMRNEEMFISCAWCKKIKRDKHWVPLDEFFRDEFSSVTSHGICLNCKHEAENELAEASAEHHRH
jgi:hypothetical protein